MFTASADPTQIKEANEYLQSIKQRGQLTVITLGKVNIEGISLLKEAG